MLYNLRHNDRPYLLASLLLAVLAAFALWHLVGPLATLLAFLIAGLVFLTAILLHLHHTRQDEDEAQLRKMQALLTLHQLLEVRGPLPPMTGWASSPELAAALVGIIRRRCPGRVVELGSGASTVVMAYALEQYGSGNLISLDHDETYRQKTLGQLRAHGLRADVFHAPLRAVTVEGQEKTWYDLPAIEGPIDLLVVDGPPYETEPMARYPAVPALLDRLAEDAVVVLDDAYRDDEAAALERWKTLLKAEITVLESDKGIAILRRNVQSN